MPSKERAQPDDFGPVMGLPLPRRDVGWWDRLPEGEQRRLLLAGYRAAVERVELPMPLQLPWAPAAAGIARRHLIGALTGLDPFIVDVAVLLTSELVTNAVMHGVEPVAVKVCSDRTTLRVEVSDGAPDLAVMAAKGWDPTAESGRGLSLVDGLASAWGSQIRRGQPGKTTWFELAPGLSLK